MLNDESDGTWRKSSVVVLLVAVGMLS